MHVCVVVSVVNKHFAYRNMWIEVEVSTLRMDQENLTFYMLHW